MNIDSYIGYIDVVGKRSFRLPNLKLNPEKLNLPLEQIDGLFFERQEQSVSFSKLVRWSTSNKFFYRHGYINIFREPFIFKSNICLSIDCNLSSLIDVIKSDQPLNKHFPWLKELL